MASCQLCHLRLPSGYRGCELSALDDEIVVNGHYLPFEDRLGLCDLIIVGRDQRLIVLHLELTRQLCDQLLIFLRALATSAGLRDQSSPPLH